MADQYVGEIRLFGFPRVPGDWVACNGGLLPIAQYEVLYSLIGTTYGGDGQQTFGVPDLQGRVPIHMGKSNQGNTYTIGQKAGEETHRLIVAEMAAHSHSLVSTVNAGTTATPAANVHLATSNVATKSLYAPTANIPGYDEMADSVGLTGMGAAHENMMPTLIMNFCIATAGIYPSSG